MGLQHPTLHRCVAFCHQHLLWIIWSYYSHFTLNTEMKISIYYSISICTEKKKKTNLCYVQLGLQYFFLVVSFGNIFFSKYYHQCAIHKITYRWCLSLLTEWQWIVLALKNYRTYKWVSLFSSLYHTVVLLLRTSIELSMFSLKIEAVRFCFVLFSFNLEAYIFELFVTICTLPC